MAISVGITGASGQIGRRLRQQLAGSPLRLKLFDQAKPDGPMEPGLYEQVDLSIWEGLCDRFRGLDVLVHLAAVSDEADWETIRRSNLDGTYNVFEAARQAGVARVVFASSHHVFGFYDISDGPLAHPQYRPSGLYGASKCFGEALARMYCDKFAMTFLVLRIAAAADAPAELRHRGVWVSYADVVDATIAAIHSSASGFVCVNVVSDNPISVYDRKDWGILDFAPRRFPGNLDPTNTDSRCGGSTCDEWHPPLRDRSPS
jgi:uronate dehydrogenase